jgi:hypothetical protein
VRAGLVVILWGFLLVTPAAHALAANASRERVGYSQTDVRSKSAKAHLGGGLGGAQGRGLRTAARAPSGHLWRTPGWLLGRLDDATHGGSGTALLLDAKSPSRRKVSPAGFAHAASGLSAQQGATLTRQGTMGDATRVRTTNVPTQLTQGVGPAWCWNDFQRGWLRATIKPLRLKKAAHALRISFSYYSRRKIPVVPVRSSPAGFAHTTTGLSAQ